MARSVEGAVDEWACQVSRAAAEQADAASGLRPPLIADVRRSENSRMLKWVSPPTLTLTLWHNGLLIAHLSNVFPHQGTWFADYDLSMDGRTDEHARRILEYISYCKDFNNRIANGDDRDFAEFDLFQDVSDCSRWCAKLANGLMIPMEGQLAFIDDQVTWQHPETQPSTEMAANELWARAASNMTPERP